MIWDAFMLNDELDMLECRLTELAEVVDRFVIVEADVTHTNQPKPSHYLESRDRFAAWNDRITHVWATGLPTESNAWSREHGQREWIGRALEDASHDDVVMQSDVDEIPNPAVVRELRLAGGFLAFEQRYYSFAVDWQMPVAWYGTVAARLGAVGGDWAGMRACRNTAPRIADGGWHLAWLGGTEQNLKKLATSPHPEEYEETRAGIESDAYLRDGATISVFGGAKMVPVDVNETWPRWIAERRCPESWFRPR